jgi:hypothetical protein
MNRFIRTGCVVAMLLAGCGGSSDDEDDKSGPTAEQKARAIEMSMGMAAATPRVAGERAATPTEGDATAGNPSAAASATAVRPANAASASAVQVSAAEAAGCIEKVSGLLATPAATQQRPDFDCAAGIYRGTTPQGQACTLKVATTRGQYRFVQSGPDITIEPDAPAGPFGGRFARYLQPTSEPAATAGPGLRISRTSTAPTVSSETIALYAGPTGTGPARLTRLSYRRVQGTQAFETHCRLEAGQPATKTAAR